MTERPLSHKQQRFVQEYMLDCNGTQAAIRAGYSPKTANPQAARMLAKVSVQSAIAEEMARKANEIDVTVAEIVAGLRAEATLADDDGGSSGNRIQALGKLGQHKGMFVDRVEHSGSASFEMHIGKK